MLVLKSIASTKEVIQANSPVSSEGSITAVVVSYLSNGGQQLTTSAPLCLIILSLRFQDKWLIMDSLISVKVLLRIFLVVAFWIRVSCSPVESVGGAKSPLQSLKMPPRFWLLFSSLSRASSISHQ